jgi:hypothetical protein
MYDTQIGITIENALIDQCCNERSINSLYVGGGSHRGHLVMRIGKVWFAQLLNYITISQTYTIINLVIKYTLLPPS